MSELERPTNREKPVALDTEWYERFEALGSFMAFEYLEGNKEHREEQKKLFMNGEIENPHLDYPKIDSDKLGSMEASFLELKRDIIAREKNETIKQAYRWRINEKIAELRMLRSAGVGNGKRFQRYSEFVYGKPSDEIFSNATVKIIRNAEEYLTSDNPDIQKAAEELLELLPADLPEAKIDSLPGKTDIDAAREQTIRELSRILSIEKSDLPIDNSAESSLPEKEYTAEEIREVFQDALESLRAEGWSVVIDTGTKVAISVDQESKQVRIPATRKLTFEKLRTLIAHEIGTHVAHRQNGERSRLKLLGLGLDRHDKGEEGVATMREQVLGTGFTDFSGLEGHVAIGLARGLDGTKRDFKSTYVILEKYFHLKALTSGKPPQEAMVQAKTNAWNRTIRTFRGTDCATPGNCFTKDIVYREGNIGVWDVIGRNPGELRRFSVGKYDPANARHIWILDQLGITDADLEDLEKPSSS